MAEKADKMTNGLETRPGGAWINAYNVVDGVSREKREVEEGSRLGVRLGVGVVVEVCNGGRDVPGWNSNWLDSGWLAKTLVPMRLIKATSPMTRCNGSIKEELFFFIAVLLFAGKLTGHALPGGGRHSRWNCLMDFIA